MLKPLIAITWTLSLTLHSIAYAEESAASRNFMMSPTLTQMPTYSAQAMLRIHDTNIAKNDLYKVKLDVDAICNEEDKKKWPTQLELKKTLCEDQELKTGPQSLEFFYKKSPSEIQRFEALSLQLTKNSDDPHAVLKDKTGKLTFLMLATNAGMMMMPESVTNWSKETKDRVLSHTARTYGEHLKKGPVFDKDPFMVNFVFHPVSGAGYYTLARNLGYTALQSFGYAILMSTQWEIIENHAEPISIQDLFVTPILGSLIGELFYQLDQYLSQNEEFRNSMIGKLVHALLNPFGSAIGLLESPERFSKNQIKAYGGFFMGSPFQGATPAWSTPSTGRNSNTDRNLNGLIGIKLGFLF